MIIAQPVRSGVSAPCGECDDVRSRMERRLPGRSACQASVKHIFDLYSPPLCPVRPSCYHLDPGVGKMTRFPPPPNQIIKMAEWCVQAPVPW